MSIKIKNKLSVPKLPVATIGGGMSFTSKLIALATIKENPNAVIVDPQGEICKNLSESLNEFGKLQPEGVIIGRSQCKDGLECVEYKPRTRAASPFVFGTPGEGKGFYVKPFDSDSKGYANNHQTIKGDLENASSTFNER